MNERPNPRDLLLYRGYKALVDPLTSKEFHQEFSIEITRVEEYLIDQIAMKRLIKDLKFT